MKATDLLKSQHREVEDLFSRIEDAEGGEKQELFQELLDALVAHDAIERELFYPECEKALGKKEILSEAIVEHGVVEFSLHQADIAKKGEEFDARVMVLKEMIEHHVEEEEDELFPLVNKEMEKNAHETLGEKMEKRFETVKASDTRSALRTRLRSVIGESLTARAKRSGDKKATGKRANGVRSSRSA